MPRYYVLSIVLSTVCQVPSSSEKQEFEEREARRGFAILFHSCRVTVKDVQKTASTGWPISMRSCIFRYLCRVILPFCHFGNACDKIWTDFDNRVVCRGFKPLLLSLQAVPSSLTYVSNYTWFQVTLPCGQQRLLPCRLVIWSFEKSPTTMISSANKERKPPGTSNKTEGSTGRARRALCVMFCHWFSVQLRTSARARARVVQNGKSEIARETFRQPSTNQIAVLTRSTRAIYQSHLPDG